MEAELGMGKANLKVRKSDHTCSLCSDNCKRLTCVNSVICSHVIHFRKHFLLKKNKENTVTTNLEVLREAALVKKL